MSMLPTIIKYNTLNTYPLFCICTHRCIKHWHSFLKSEIQQENLCYSVFTPTQHYIYHLKDIITTLGPLRAYSSRSQERVIGRFKRYIKGKTKLGVSAGIILERLAFRDYYDNEFDDVMDDEDDDKDEGFKKSKWADFLDLSNRRDAQLWAPIDYDVEYTKYAEHCKTFEDVGLNTFKKALKKFYIRQYPNVRKDNVRPAVTVLNISGRAWTNKLELSSAVYSDRKKFRTKANEFVMFRIPKDNNSKNDKFWYIGSALFFFQHTYNHYKRLLALVKLADSQTVPSFTNNIPSVSVSEDTFYFGRRNHDIPPSTRSKYAVIEIHDITTIVGLVYNPDTDDYNAVSPDIGYNTDYSKDIGDLSIF